MPTCSSCGQSIPESQMKHGSLGDLFSDMMGANAKRMPNVMEELAMKCDRCGNWICNRCATGAASATDAGMLQHAGCGGMFETP